MKRNTVVISLGGSMIINGSGVHIEFLKKFRRIIEAESKKGLGFIIIAGGGNTARVYQTAGRKFKFTDTELDTVGIAACRMNGEFLKALLKGIRGTEVAFGGKPGESSDGIATRHAIARGATQVINISSIAYVYDSDPVENPNAQRFETLSWKQYRAIVGSEWIPGMHAPFDPTAARLAQKHNIQVAFMSGNSLNDLSKILHGKAWGGSSIE